MVGGSAALDAPSSSSRASPVPYSTPKPGEEVEAARLGRLPRVPCADRGREDLLSVSENLSSPVMMGGGVRVSSDSRMELITVGFAGLDLTCCDDRLRERCLCLSLSLCSDRGREDREREVEDCCSHCANSGEGDTFSAIVAAIPSLSTLASLPALSRAQKQCALNRLEAERSACGSRDHTSVAR